jgi:hypothetical protein
MAVHERKQSDWDHDWLERRLEDRCERVGDRRL